VDLGAYALFKLKVLKQDTAREAAWIFNVIHIFYTLFVIIHPCFIGVELDFDLQVNKM